MQETAEMLDLHFKAHGRSNILCPSSASIKPQLCQWHHREVNVTVLNIC